MRALAPAVAVLCLLTAVGCGGTSAADKAAAEAKAACEVFVHFHPPAGASPKASAKATYGAFLEAAYLARQAALRDPRWRVLQTATRDEAEAFQVIATATIGAGHVTRASVRRAVAQTAAARPVFMAQCMKADPATFATTGATAPPPPSPAVT